MIKDRWTVATELFGLWKNNPNYTYIGDMQFLRKRELQIASEIADSVDYIETVRNVYHSIKRKP